eukprot:2632521-Rhodomonas_salina.3
MRRFCTDVGYAATRSELAALGPGTAVCDMVVFLGEVRYLPTRVLPAVSVMVAVLSGALLTSAADSLVLSGPICYQSTSSRSQPPPSSPAPSPAMRGPAHPFQPPPILVSFRGLA